MFVLAFSVSSDFGGNRKVWGMEVCALKQCLHIFGECLGFGGGFVSSRSHLSHLAKSHWFAFHWLSRIRSTGLYQLRPHPINTLFFELVCIRDVDIFVNNLSSRLQIYNFNIFKYSITLIIFKAIFIYQSNL